MESLHEKITTCFSNLEKSSATKINKHTAFGYSLFIHCSFDNRKKTNITILEVKIVRKYFSRDLKIMQ